MGQDLKNSWIILCQLITLGAGQAKIEVSRPLAPAYTQTPLQGPERNFRLVHGVPNRQSQLPLLSSAELWWEAAGGSR